MRTLPFTLHNKHTNFCYFIAGKLHIFSLYWMQEIKTFDMCSHIVTLQFILPTWQATNSSQPLSPVIPDVSGFRRMHFSDCRATHLSCQTFSGPRLDSMLQMVWIISQQIQPCERDLFYLCLQRHKKKSCLSLVQSQSSSY